MPDPQTGTGTDPEGATPDGGTGTEEPTPGDGGTSEPEPEGGHPAGSKEAVLADLARERKLRQEERDRRQAAERELEERKREGMDEVERARAEARDEALAVANDRLRRAAVMLAAERRGFHDASDATALVNLEGIDVDENGEVDEAAVRDALEALAERKPHLLRQTDGETPPGSPTGGADVHGSGDSGSGPSSDEDWNRGLRAAAGFHQRTG